MGEGRGRNGVGEDGRKATEPYVPTVPDRSDTTDETLHPKGFCRF